MSGQSQAVLPQAESHTRTMEESALLQVRQGTGGLHAGDSVPTSGGHFEKLFSKIPPRVQFDKNH